MRGYIGPKAKIAIVTNPRIYLDHAATTPLRPEARAAMEEGFALWANPSSPHTEGRRARAALEDARERVKAALGWEGEVIFTSGASEAAALALHGARGGRRFVSAVEHDAVLRAAPTAGVIPVLGNGSIDFDALELSLAGEDTPVVAVQLINSETGNCQDVEEVCGRVDDAGGLSIIDASQGAGKYRFCYHSSMVIVSAHKFGGPVGVGALLVHDFSALEPTGGHERGYRRGTENLPGVLGMAAALEAGGEPYLDWHSFEAAAPLAQAVRAIGGTWFDDILDAPTGYIHAVAMPHLSAKAQLMRFDMAGIAVSQGSACSSGTMKRSHVLTAMGVPDDIADRTIRVSFGWTTTRAEVERFCEVWLDMARGAA
jgi:cysteine desulfurase